MGRRFNSFIVRFWQRADGDHRIAITYVQDGTQVIVDSLARALPWIEACTSAVNHPQHVKECGHLEERPQGDRHLPSR